ncbi:uncharacterized protein BX664DRAFT_333250, partial [Halteromyces radiatus]|uniref:uncharacterized protein n=1 Tax=Halteromyces radiatus TaxID=101107 RepID=UPI00221EC90B
MFVRWDAFPFFSFSFFPFFFFSGTNMSEGNDAWDDWETAADAGLADFKGKPAIPKAQEKSKQNNMEDSNTKLWKQANEHTTPIIIRTDTVQTQYQPEIKILKRSETPRARPSSTSTNTTPIKTLEEREKDYKLARMRIFGKND